VGYDKLRADRERERERERDGWTDMTKKTVAFLNVANAPANSL